MIKPIFKYIAKIENKLLLFLIIIFISILSTYLYGFIFTVYKNSCKLRQEDVTEIRKLIISNEDEFITNTKYKKLDPAFFPYKYAINIQIFENKAPVYDNNFVESANLKKIESFYLKSKEGRNFEVRLSAYERKSWNKTFFHWLNRMYRWHKPRYNWITIPFFVFILSYCILFYKVIPGILKKND